MSKTFADLLKTVSREKDKVVTRQAVNKVFSEKKTNRSQTEGGQARKSTKNKKVATKPKKLGDKREVTLAEVRRRCGITQVQLAEKLGMKQPSIAQFEGQRDACISTLRQYLRGLGLELEVRVILDAETLALDEQYNK